MKCQHCGVYEATFHYRSNINGQIAEQHLCVACAQSTEGGLFAGVATNPMELFFGGGMFGGRMGSLPQAQTRPAFAPTPAPQAPAMEPGEGSIPAEADDALRQRRQLNQMRQEMQSAVEADQFERATELRDEIHRLEQGM